MSGYKENYFIQQMLTNDMKDLQRDFLYRVKFHSITKDGTLNDTDHKDIVDDSTFLFHTRKVDGLPKLSVAAITDDFYMYKQKLPGRVDEFGPLTVGFVIKEMGDPLDGFINQMNKITKTQLDFREDNGFNYTKEGDAFKYDAQSVDTYSKYMKDLSKDVVSGGEKGVFFATTVTLLNYNTYEPTMTIVFKNCWLQDISFDGNLAGGELLKGSASIIYDYPEVYKVTKN